MSLRVCLSFLILLCSCSLKSPKRNELEKLAHQNSFLEAVVIVVVDQLSSEAFSRIKPQGGFKLLNERALFFPNARYPYLHPETCPGHATIATGFYPSAHGIVANEWKDVENKKQIYCVEDPVYKRSAALLLKPTLGDLLKKIQPRTSVVTLSGKDRSAIMLAGHHADQALWYDSKTGNFISSPFYPAPSAAVQQFNEERHWDDFFMNPWVVSKGRQYPYGFGLERDTEFFESLYQGPAVDRLTFDLFKQLVEKRDRTSALSYFGLSLSSLDTVGHRYGSSSEEYRSVLSQLEMIVGELLSLLDKEFGEQGYILALTADHGVLPVERKGYGRVSAEDVECARSARTDCKNFVEQICYNDLKPSSPFFEAAKNSYFPQRSESRLPVYKRGLLPALPPGTGHVTPYPEDTDVPLWLLLPNEMPRTTSEHVSPAAIVPSIFNAINRIDHSGAFRSREGEIQNWPEHDLAR